MESNTKTSRIVIKIIAFGLWIYLLLQGFYFAPDSTPESADLVAQMFQGNFSGLDPSFIMLFNLMGIWPLLYVGVLAFEHPSQKITPWLFLIASFGLGAFVLLPYFFLRRATPIFQGSKGKFLKSVDRKIFGILLGIISTALVIYGIFWSDWELFWNALRTNNFIYVMSNDFLVLYLAFPLGLADDMRRRDYYSQKRLILFSIVPIFSPIVYMIKRPRIMP